MNGYKILWKKSAEKEVLKIPSTFSDLISFKINSLSKTPLPLNAKKLKGSESFYRMRIGDYRVIYSVDKKNRTIIIYYIRHRKDIYKHLRLD